jgi:ATP-dependent exoDNAse (exonuclease V) beta subunit
VIARPDGDPAGPLTVSPGQHDFDAGYRAVWWDPTILHLGVETTEGIRREELIMRRNVDPAVVAEGRRDYEEWRRSRDAAIASGSRPSLQVTTARRLAATADPAIGAPSTAPVSTFVVGSGHDPQRPARPAGPAFGVLVHTVLATVPLDAPGQDVARVADTQARLLGLDAADARSAAGLVSRVLETPLLQQAREAAARGRCRRECPVSLVLPDGTLVEGVVDLAFERDEEWVVVDYKTDREIAATGEEQYRRQIAIYASAIAHATGRPARGVLVSL